LDDGYCALHAGVTPGDYVELSVRDNGCGMNQQTMESMFEPFFTTKKLGKGTGLGLSTVYGIIKQNDGFIDVDSEPDKGAIFRIYLPRRAGEVESVEMPKRMESLQGRGETVLIVEDEPAVLKLGEMMLQGLGYSPLSARTPHEALELAQKYAGSIHLLITEVIMPQMNGRELAERMQALNPRLNVLFMSGYTENIMTEQGVLNSGVHFIQKPFHLRDLAGKVIHALGQA
jgi:two-component system, cell cycle sensor histidine kinase and response regulator CckA